MGLVTSSGHLVHMPVHIWLAIGDYDAALATNIRAAQADKAYVAQTGVISSYYMIGYLHDLVFIVYARAMQGRLPETRKAIDTIRSSLAPILVVMPEMSGASEMYIGFIEMRMGMWDELLAAPQPKDQNPVFTGMWHYGRPMALLRKGRPKEARQEQTEFEQLRKKIDRNIS